MICGLVTINDEQYMFRLEGNELRAEAIKHIGKGYIILDWLNNPPQIDNKYLFGINQLTGKRIIFRIIPGSIGFKNTELIIQVVFYIELETEEKISEITILSDELNYIYNAHYGIDEFSFDDEGFASCKTKSCEKNISEKEYLVCNGKSIEVVFSISPMLQFQSSTPIVLKSSMILRFDETDDYDFLFDMITIARQFIVFLCYRKNIHMTEIILSTTNENKKYQSIGKVHCPKWQKMESEDYKILSRRYISYNGVKGHIGEILQDIQNGLLYMRHIPQDYNDSRRMDHPKFIMITAAIEWIAKELYSNGIEHSTAKEKAIEQVRQELDEKINSYSGKIKEIYKSLKRVLGSDSLSSRINQICKDYSEIITPFGKYLYSNNAQTENFDIHKLSQRIENQRNNFAHGNLDKEYDNLASLDIIFIEKVIYILQLSKYGIENTKIISEVKRLFGMSF